MLSRFLSVVLFLCLSISIVFGAQFTSVGSGNWFDPSTWGTGTFPGLNDDVTITIGHTVNLDGASQISVRSLQIGTYNPTVSTAALIGPEYMNCAIVVSEGVMIGSGDNPGRLIEGTGGTISLTLGGNLSLYSTSELSATQTIFTAGALSAGVDPQLYAPMAILATTFFTLNDSYMLEILSNITFEDLSTFGFAFTRMDLWSSVTISNAVLSNCQYTPRNADSHNRLNNCHLYSTTCAMTTYISGPVALMDNGNSFDCLVIESGSLWGNYGNDSSFVVMNDLHLTTGATLSPGIYGTLSLYIGGDLSSQTAIVSYLVDHTYFNGSRSELDPQVITSGYADIGGSFHNVNSHLSLDGELEFVNPINCMFEGGNIVSTTEVSVIKNCVLTNTVFVNCDGRVYGCSLGNVTFQGIAVVNHCSLADNNVSFYSTANFFGECSGAYGQDSFMTFYAGTVVVNPGATISPGSDGLLDLRISDTIMIYGTVNAHISFYGTSCSLQVDGLSIINNGISNYSEELDLFTYGLVDGDLNLHNNSFNSVPGSLITLHANLTFSNLTLLGGAFESVNGKALALNNVSVENCNFGLLVTLLGYAYLNDNNVVFERGLTVNGGSLDGAYGAGSTVVVDNLSIISGTVAPGIGGTLEVYLSGNLNVSNSEVGASYDATITRFTGIIDQAVYMPAAVCNSTFTMNGTQGLSFLSTITFSEDLTKSINSYNGSNIFYLNGYGIVNANLGGGRYSDGYLQTSRLYYLHCENVEIRGICLLGNNENEFYGTTLISGEINGVENYDSFVRIDGPITVEGQIRPGHLGTLLAHCYSDINLIPGPTVYWGGIIEICGNGERTLTMPILGSNLSELVLRTHVENSPILIGTSYIPQLEIVNTSMLTVAPDAALHFIPGQYYSGQLILQGSIHNATYGNVYEHAYHNLTVSLNEIYSEVINIFGQHTMHGPDNLTGNTGEYWALVTHNAIPGVLGTLTFTYAQGRTEGLGLYISIDSGATWELFTGSVFNASEEGYFIAYNAPLNARYALAAGTIGWIGSALLNPIGAPHVLCPVFNWDPINGGVAYYVLVSTDIDFNNIAAQGIVTANTSYQFDACFAPDTQYWWKVYATSTIFGDLSSSARSFTTRQAITTNLPEHGEFLPGDLMMYYIPAFVQNLMPGETISVNAVGSEHLSTFFEDGTLTITASPGWTGQEQISLNIWDGYTTINRQMQITILGSPQALNVSIQLIGEYWEDVLTYEPVPGADYYLFYTAESPEGPWRPCAWSTMNWMLLSHTEAIKFYKVTANTGEPPRMLPGK